jgi:hypothetical protein
MTNATAHRDPPADAASASGTVRSAYASLLLRAGFATLAILLSLLTLELGGRLYGRATNHERGITFDSELGWRPLPNVSKIGTVWGVARPASTNSRGWRDPERAYETKSAGVRRAVAVGDSFTFGTDVDDGERFTDKLAARMEHLEVLNVGVPGFGTDQELRLLETEALGYQPDVVILTICVFNDLDDISYERLYSWPKPHYSLDNGRLHLVKPIRTWDIRLRTSSYLIEFFYQRFFGEVSRPRRAPDFAPSKLLPLFEALIQRIASLAANHNARLIAVLAYAPEGVTGDFSELSGPILEVLDRAGVARLDTRRLFAANSADPNHDFYSTVGKHWNSAGNALVAVGLAKLLGELGVKD